jgi:hypothetical protein
MQHQITFMLKFLALSPAIQVRADGKYFIVAADGNEFIVSSRKDRNFQNWRRTSSAIA